MAERPVVSIIVPVFNVEKYLSQCLDSILAQTLKDIEIILIDDGSSDSSVSIMDDYASRDSRIVAVHTPNHGVSSARNRGIEMASGKYIGFVDSDDHVDDAMFEKMVDVAEKSDADCVQCEYETVFDSGKMMVSGGSDKMMVYERPEAICALMSQSISYTVWSKIFRREAIGTLRFFEKWQFGEDFRFIAEFLSECGKVCTIPDVLYHYYAWSGSLAHKVIDEKKARSLEVYDILKEKSGGSEIVLKSICERELSETLRCLNASIGHKNIHPNVILALTARLEGCKTSIKGNRYMTSSERTMARLASCCPKLYVFFVKCFKRLKGIR